jgi:hypothetical protein
MTSDQPPVSASTLREALKFFLEDDNYVDRLEADGIKTLIEQDGKISEEEKGFIRDALANVNFDAQALAILQKLLE